MSRTVGHSGLAVRSAVRALLEQPACAAHRRAGVIGVAVSGGPDSLALAEATEHTCRALGLRPRAVIIDHGLQAGSGEVADQAAGHARELGIEDVRVRRVEVDGPGGLEAAARRARYKALRKEVPEPGALVLLGHTRDDQAETVLLGLGRGSGARSLAGMRPLDPPWARPLLDVARSATAEACAELGLRPWQDPHNADPRFTRVRLRREVLPLLDEVLQGGVGEALARTATQLTEDLTALDACAAELDARARTACREPAAGEPSAGEPPAGELDAGELDAGELAGAYSAVRRRVLRRWLRDAGVRELTDAHLRSVDDLVANWRGQGGVWLPGDRVASRREGRLSVHKASAPAGRPRR